MQGQYTYEPFGKTTATGEASTNAFTYTGREDDGTGVYYYRARYYHPGLQRFISEDPIGFDGGDVNLYGYVGNDPVNFTDPLGLWTVTAGGSLRIPGWLSGLFGSIGQGGGAGIALSYCEGQWDFGLYGTLQGGGEEYGIGMFAGSVGLHQGGVPDLAGYGADVSGQFGSYGGTAHFNSNGSPTGASYNLVGQGYYAGATGTVTGTLSVGQGFSGP